MILLDVTVLSPTQVIFEGKARNMIVPGEQGVFEVLPFHKRILSRLLAGTMLIFGETPSEERGFPMRRGIIKVNKNRVTVIMEEAL